jgi:hypothetical protein
LWYFLRKKRFLVPSSATRNRGQPKQRSKRALIFVLAALLAVALGRVTAAFAQTGYDRPGGDYTSAPVANGDPTVCAARCERDKGCRAWSFSYPSGSGAPRTPDTQQLDSLAGTTSRLSQHIAGAPDPDG